MKRSFKRKTHSRLSLKFLLTQLILFTWCNFRTTEFLNRLQTVAENHHFFQEGYSPSEMDDLPDTFRSIIDNTADMHDAFHSTKSELLTFSFFYVVTCVSYFQTIL